MTASSWALIYRQQCFRRKVRCNYETPCNRCRDTQLTCTHSIVRKKRGPRKGRGAVLDNLRSRDSLEDRLHDRSQSQLEADSNNIGEDNGSLGSIPSGMTKAFSKLGLSSVDEQQAIEQCYQVQHFREDLSLSPPAIQVVFVGSKLLLGLQMLDTT